MIHALANTTAAFSCRTVALQQIDISTQYSLGGGGTLHTRGLGPASA